MYVGGVQWEQSSLHERSKRKKGSLARRESSCSATAGARADGRSSWRMRRLRRGERVGEVSFALPHFFVLVSIDISLVTACADLISSALDKEHIPCESHALPNFIRTLRRRLHTTQRKQAFRGTSGRQIALTSSRIAEIIIALCCIGLSKSKQVFCYRITWYTLPYCINLYR